MNSWQLQFMQNQETGQLTRNHFTAIFLGFVSYKIPKTSIIEENAQFGMKSYSKKKIAVKIVLILRKFLVAFKYRFDSITRMPSLSL